MKRTWRDADRAADLTGQAVHRTVGSSDARNEWFPLLLRVLSRDEVIRIRHRSYDEPAVLMRESTFRNLERAADSTTSPRSSGGLAVPPPADIGHEFGSTYAGLVLGHPRAKHVEVRKRVTTVDPLGT
ncbi:MAG: hypothetical protein OEM23_02995 [Gemmatimonadota bacterium]|nr:hypothetical protein [Gemmatimonadota bacterium]MDH3427378.1 hypothetical protein [Gemmatimonadota bacterium]